jgi:hypothetical protein
LNQLSETELGDVYSSSSMATTNRAAVEGSGTESSGVATGEPLRLVC